MGLKQYDSIISVIRDIPIILRCTISAISIHSFPDGYKGSVHFAVHIEGDIGISLMDYADYQVEGIKIGGWGSLTDLEFILPGELDIAREIINLGDDSCLLGTINACRYDTQDVKARIIYGYPCWIIKPNSLKSLMIYENGNIRFFESKLGTTKLKQGDYDGIEKILLLQGIIDYKNYLGTT